MKKTVQLTASLTIIAAAAGISISSMYDQTKKQILAQKEAQTTNALKSLFPQGAEITADTLKKSDGGIQPFWYSTASGKITGIAFEASGKGYSSTVKYLASVNPEGKILGISILSQAETPGLGTRMQESVSKATFWNGLFAKREKIEPWFQTQFKNLNALSPISISKAGEWHTLSAEKRKELAAKNEVTAITGSTISTKAVTDALFAQSSSVKEITNYLASKNGGSL